MNRNGKLCLLGLLAFALIIRLVLLSRPNEPVFDELHYLPFLEKMLSGYRPILPHPPLGIMLPILGIKFLGYNSFGWRIVPVFFAVIGIALTYLLSLKITQKPSSALYAALLLSFSTLWFTISRIDMLDIFLAVFLLGAAYFCLNENFLGFGLLSGLALATKWIAIVPIFLLYFWFVGGAIFYGKKHKIVNYLQFIGLFLLIFLVYFGVNAFYYRDVNLLNFFNIQKQILEIHSGKSINLAYSSPAWSWYLIPQAIPCFNLAPGWFNKIIIMENPALLWWGVVSALFAGWRIIRGKSTKLLFPFLLWVSLYLPFFFLQRALYLFYIIPALPFLYIMAGDSLDEAFDSGLWSKVYLGFVILAFFYLYPQMVMK